MTSSNLHGKSFLFYNFQSKINKNTDERIDFKASFLVVLHFVSKALRMAL